MIMLITPNLPSGYSIFCEDIRHEVNGARSLIGVYGPVITAPRIDDNPVILSRLAIENVIRLDNQILPESCILRVIFETNSFVETELARGDFEFDHKNLPPAQISEFAKRDGTGAQAQLMSQIQIANVLIPESGRIKVRLSYGDDVIALGSLLVNIVTPENPAT